jgi:hypothetical protein
LVAKNSVIRSGPVANNILGSNGSWSNLLDARRRGAPLRA